MSPWNRVHLPGGSGGGSTEVTNEKLIYELPVITPTANDANALATRGLESHHTPEDTAAAGVLLTANEAQAIAADVSLSTLTAIGLHSHPVAIDDYSAIIALGNEGPPSPSDLEAIAASVLELVPATTVLDEIVATAYDNTTAPNPSALDSIAARIFETIPGAAELGTIVANLFAGANAASGGTNPANATGQPDGVRATTDGGLFGASQTLTLTYQDFNLGDLVLSNPRVRVVGQVFSNLDGASSMVIDYSLNNGGSYTNLATITAPALNTIDVDNTYNLPITTDAHLDGFQMRFTLNAGSLSGSAGIDAAVLLGAATKDY